MMQAAPGAFDLLELRCMQNFVDLLSQLSVEPGDHLFDRVEHVLLDDTRVGEGLSDQGCYRILDLGGCALGARLEALLEDLRKFVSIACLDDSALLLRYRSCRH